jgi:flagellar protein FliJ
MPRFVFKLEAVRSLREQRQQQAEQDLAYELSVRDQRARELSAASLRVDQALAEATPQTGGNASAHELAARQAWVERVRREQQTAQVTLDSQESQVEAGRQRLEAASREREVLERLRERRLTAHRRDAERRDEAILGEVALAAHRRKAAEAS